jgi:2-(1,2-epoxy-1,2-dihydrophenyl)acetyl-CoA isomerase
MLGSGLSASLSLEILRKLGGVILAIRKIPQPVVVKVRGAAWGGGANLALAGDFVLAAHDARFCEVFVNICTVLDGGGTYFLPRLVGLAKARELALLGDEFDGKTAASIGLIYKSVPGRQLDRHVNALAEKLSKRHLKALSLIKEGLESSFDMTLPEALEWEASHQAIMFQSEEHRESVKGFLTRKK